MNGVVSAMNSKLISFFVSKYPSFLLEQAVPVPPKSAYPNVSQVGSQRCCETGRPIMADPITGTTICSCQMKSGTQAYLSRMAGLQEAVYSGASQLFQPSALVGTDASAFYPMVKYLMFKTPLYLQ